jgi:hypothetical protein
VDQLEVAQRVAFRCQKMGVARSSMEKIVSLVANATEERLTHTYVLVSEEGERTRVLFDVTMNRHTKARLGRRDFKAINLATLANHIREGKEIEHYD